MKTNLLINQFSCLTFILFLNLKSLAQQSPVKEIIPDIESPVITGVEISSDEKWIVSCFRKVQIIDADTGQIVQEHNEHEFVKKNTDTPVGIRSINLSNDNNLVVSGDNLFNIIVWDRTQNKRLIHFSSTNLDPSGGGIVGVAVMPDNKRVLSANGNGTLEMWNIESGVLIKRYRN